MGTPKGESLEMKLRRMTQAAMKATPLFEDQVDDLKRRIAKTPDLRRAIVEEAILHVALSAISEALKDVKKGG